MWRKLSDIRSLTKSYLDRRMPRKLVFYEFISYKIKGGGNFTKHKTLNKIISLGKASIWILQETKNITSSGFNGVFFMGESGS